MSAKAHEHPDNVRTERLRAEQALKDISITQKLKFGYAKRQLSSFIKGASDGMNKFMPSAGGAASNSVKKAVKQKANAYEAKRAKELQKERLEYEREVKIRNRV